MNNKSLEWDNLLNPKIVKQNLIIASIYISAFELFKDTIVDRIREFYSHGFDDMGLILSDDYKLKVLSKNKSPIYGSLYWLQEMDAIDKNDINIFEASKNLRNSLVHKFHKIHSEGLPDGVIECFQNLVSLFGKIEKWWMINIEAEIDSEMQDALKDADLDSIVSGPLLSIRLLIDIALGSEQEANYYYNEFKKNQK
ncbi:MAG: hypothetical protein IPL92_17930 [Saprospiraceae bacterium]|nr:hypothetical protein [Candidatus Opimibacter iunctus]